jgi:hypothetical protein
VYSGSFDSSGESGNFKGNTFGLQLGYLGDYFMAGINIEKGQYVFDKRLTSDNYTEYAGGGVGTFLGFHFLDHWKIWTGYLNTSFEPINNGAIRYFGQHVSFGLGYRLYDGLMLNYEGFRNQFTQKEDDVTGKTQGLASNIKTEGYAISLSYIFAI